MLSTRQGLSVAAATLVLGFLGFLQLQEAERVVFATPPPTPPRATPTKPQMLKPRPRDPYAHLREKQRVWLANESTKYVTWDWNTGRINNQLASMSAVARLAKSADRVLLIPRPSHQNHFLGLHDNAEISMWDLAHFAQTFDFILWSSVPRNHPAKLGHAVENRCKMSEGFVKAGEWATMLADPRRFMQTTKQDCKLIHFGGRRGIIGYMDNQLQRLPVSLADFWSALRPAVYIQQAAHDFAASVHWGPTRLAVHSRIFIENIPCSFTESHLPGLVSDCKKFLGEELRSAWTRGLVWWKNKDEERQQLPLLQSACWFSADTIDASLALMEAPLRIAQRAHHFYLASGKLSQDHESCGMLEKNLSAYGAVEYDFERLFPTRSNHSQWAARGNYVARILSPRMPVRRKELQRTERALFDLVMLGEADHFLGNCRSTMSQTVCYWRGERRADTSNMCPLFLRRVTSSDF